MLIGGVISQPIHEAENSFIPVNYCQQAFFLCSPKLLQELIKITWDISVLHCTFSLFITLFYTSWSDIVTRFFNFWAILIFHSVSLLFLGCWAFKIIVTTGCVLAFYEQQISALLENFRPQHSWNLTFS